MNPISQSICVYLPPGSLSSPAYVHLTLKKEYETSFASVISSRNSSFLAEPALERPKSCTHGPLQPTAGSSYHLTHASKPDPSTNSPLRALRPLQQEDWPWRLQRRRHALALGITLRNTAWRVCRAYCRSQAFPLIIHDRETGLHCDMRLLRIPNGGQV